jgi:hypothetical protein
LLKEKAKREVTLELETLAPLVEAKPETPTVMEIPQLREEK